MAKELVNVNWNKGPVADAIAKDVAAQIASANSALATWRGYVGLCASGHMQPDHAAKLLQNINARLMEARKKNHDPRKVAPIQESRVSEAKSILRLAEYKCWPAVFDMLKGMDVNSGGRGVNAGTLLAVSKFIRRDAKWNKETATPPARDKVLRAIDARRKGRRGEPANPNVANVRNPETTLAAMKRQVRGLAKWFAKDKPKYLDGMLRTLADLEAAAKMVAKSRATAEA